jgi:DUF4097 and DUF4098 domain-containing protein YvlB
MGLLLAAALLLTTDSEASGAIRRPVSPDARVEIQSHSGSITVVAWDKPEVVVEDGDGIDFEGSDRWIKISVARHHDAELQVKVPAGVQLEIHGHSTDVKVTGVKANVSVGVVSGNITVVGPVPSVELSTVSGDVHLEAPSKKSHTESVSGDVTVRGVTGALEASSVNGSLDVEGKAIEDAHLETVSGDLKFHGDLLPQGRLNAQTVSGDIALSFPAGIEADFETSTFSGEIKSDLGGKAVSSSKYTSSKRLSFTTGKGGAKVSVKSMSGTIEIGH